MIPDLGKYAVAVLSSYGVSLALIAIIVWTSLRRSARVRRALEEMEKRRTPDA
jgi:heme exporter protein D